MIRLWRMVNGWRWFARIPTKVLFFGAVVTLALFPRFWLIPQYLTRITNMNGVLDPQNPGLAEFEAAVRARLPVNADAANIQVCVERVVYERIPYDWDWNVWGNMDHLPTVDEVLQRRVDDCDGRAVIAASILRRMGYKAWLVSDIVHTWVQTEQFETMSPRDSAKTFIATDTGTKFDARPSALLAAAVNLAHGLGYGVNVFPLWRQLTILFAFCVVLLHPRGGVFRGISGSALALAPLPLLQIAARLSDGGEKVPVAVVATAGACLLAALLVLIFPTRAGKKISTEAAPTAA